jgi:serine protease Do
MMTKRNYVPALVIAVTLGMGILIGSFISHGVRAAKPAGRATDARLIDPPSPVTLSSSFARVADLVESSVVNIKTETDVQISRHHPDKPDDSLDGLFDHFFHFGAPSGSIPETSLGSGVVLDPAGYILTNYHVIMRDGEDRPADRMRVYLKDDDETSKGHRARIVGFDKWTDLAVIKIDTSKPLAVATLGDSDTARVGDWVLAIGSPFGLSSTVTAGIISAKGRGIEPGRDGEFKRFIQTDAAINPGNSGGPLVNLGGQVIGINTAIATNRDAYDGVGFAIPSNNVREVYNDIVSTGQVRRGAIGVTFTNGHDEAVLEALGTDHGVVVESVADGSPAEKAGLRLGDVILSIGSKRISSGDDLLTMISESSPGTHLKVGYLRDGKSLSTDIVVGDWNKIVGEVERPEDKPASTNASDKTQGPLGLSVKDLTPDQARTIARDLRLSGPEGVVVADVKGGSFADDLGLGRFDVILSINRQPILSVEDFRRAVSALRPGQNALFLVAREDDGGGFTTVFLADRLP